MAFDRSLYEDNMRMSWRVYQLLGTEITDQQAEHLIKKIRLNSDWTLAEQNTYITNYLS